MTCDRSVVSAVSSTSKTDRHDITEILLKVALSTINQSEYTFCTFPIWFFYSIYNLYTYLYELLTLRREKR